MTREGLAEALQLFNRALEVDSRFGVAATMALAATNILRGWAPLKPEIEEVTRLLRAALGIDEIDPEALATAGNLTLLSGDLDAAKEMVDRAVALNSNSAFVWNQTGAPIGLQPAI